MEKEKAKADSKQLMENSSTKEAGKMIAIIATVNSTAKMNLQLAMASIIRIYQILKKTSRYIKVVSQTGPCKAMGSCTLRMERCGKVSLRITKLMALGSFN